MSMNWNDPKLTAYALGELDGAELREMEALVKESEDARKYVEEVRQTAQMLQSELKAEPLPSLKPSQREKIVGKPSMWRSFWLPAAGLAAAAVLALVVALPMVSNRQGKVADELAMMQAEPMKDSNLVAGTGLEEGKAVKTSGARVGGMGEAKREQPAIAANAPAPEPPAEALAMADAADSMAASESVEMEMAAPAERQAAPAAPPQAMTLSQSKESGSATVKGYGYGSGGFGVGGKGGLAKSNVVNKKTLVSKQTPAEFKKMVEERLRQKESGELNTESYSYIAENEFLKTLEQPLSTFSIDVDTASYSLVRRFLMSGSLPPPDAVRLEEMINYFPYDYSGPKDDKPFAVKVEQVKAPWKKDHTLVRIGIKGKDIDMSKTLVTIAKDVKIQVEFNPKFVAGYRLIGYENRMLKKEDFNDDTKDAGEIGAGHTVTALYEIIPAGGEVPGPAVDKLKYLEKAKATPEAAQNDSNELLTVKLRYKQPEGDKSALIEIPVVAEPKLEKPSSADMHMTAAVAEFGMLLRDSKFKGDASLKSVKNSAEKALSGSRSKDPYRKEFLELVKKAEGLKKSKKD